MNGLGALGPRQAGGVGIGHVRELLPGWGHLGNGGCPEEAAQQCVVVDRHVNELRSDAPAAGLLGLVARQLQDLGGQVLDDGCQVDRCG